MEYSAIRLELPLEQMSFDSMALQITRSIMVMIFLD
jgi:hypothetical protein